MAARSSAALPAHDLLVELEPASPVGSPAWDMELELGGGVFLRLLRRGAC